MTASHSYCAPQGLLRLVFPFAQRNLAVLVTCDNNRTLRLQARVISQSIYSYRCLTEMHGPPAPLR